jgi:hypothetical protein
VEVADWLGVGVAVAVIDAVDDWVADAAWDEDTVCEGLAAWDCVTVCDAVFDWDAVASCVAVAACVPEGPCDGETDCDSVASWDPVADADRVAEGLPERLWDGVSDCDCACVKQQQAAPNRTSARAWRAGSILNRAT